MITRLHGPVASREELTARVTIDCEEIDRFNGKAWRLYIFGKRCSPVPIPGAGVRKAVR